ncbi:MAG: 1,4-dihydroxy-2-naphthoate polyprenyltransferase [Bifidobacteriaceae bacterium]|jgi:1,4-dihydroxy-2-naphthoate octaprenyltransferase|nr:1,4-dihydroxy-2-naphthoate polyprenyltransferase [Bifidobacteriaceae bacterium]
MSSVHAAWIEGLRVRTLAAAIAPVLVGLGAAIAIGPVSVGRAVLALVVALALQIGVNFANDYSDGVRGTDAAREGPQRLVASGAASPGAVRAVAWAAFLVAAAAGIALSWLSGHPWLVCVGAAAIAAAWLYTGGPRPYGYMGLGEVGVFVFFGLVAVLGTTYTQVSRITVPSVLGACGVGLAACAILMANNIRDLTADSASGKRTAAVLLGDRLARTVYQAELLGAFACAAAIVPWNPRCLAALILLPPAIRLIGPVGRGASGADMVAVLRGTGQIELGYGLILGLALALG